MTNWPGAVLMLRHYRAKSLWEHITIMLLAMSQNSELFFFFLSILERHSVSQTAYHSFCVFAPRAGEKDTVSRISKNTLGSVLCLPFVLLLLFFLQSRETHDAKSCKAAKRVSATIKFRWNLTGANQSVSCFLDKRETWEGKSARVKAAALFGLNCSALPDDHRVCIYNKTKWHKKKKTTMHFSCCQWSCTSVVVHLFLLLLFLLLLLLGVQPPRRAQYLNIRRGRNRRRGLSTRPSVLPVTEETPHAFPPTPLALHRHTDGGRAETREL